MKTATIEARRLVAGMKVVCVYTRKVRTLTTDAVACRAGGYVRAETSDRGNPVNCHGSTILTIEG